MNVDWGRGRGECQILANSMPMSRAGGGEGTSPLPPSRIHVCCFAISNISVCSTTGPMDRFIVKKIMFFYIFFPLNLL